MKVNECPSKQEVIDRAAKRTADHLVESWIRRFGWAVEECGVNPGERAKFSLAVLVDSKDEPGIDQAVSRFMVKLSEDGWQEILIEKIHRVIKRPWYKRLLGIKSETFAYPEIYVTVTRPEES